MSRGTSLSGDSTHDVCRNVSHSRHALCRNVIVLGYFISDHEQLISLHLYKQKYCFVVVLSCLSCLCTCTKARLIWNQTDTSVCVPNQSEKGKYNLISGWFNMISKRFFWVCVGRWIHFRILLNLIKFCFIIKLRRFFWHPTEFHLVLQYLKFKLCMFTSERSERSSY